MSPKKKTKIQRANKKRANQSTVKKLEKRMKKNAEVLRTLAAEEETKTTEE